MILVRDRDDRQAATRARPRAQGVQSAPRCTNGSPARQRSRKRPIGGCSGELGELEAAHDAHVAHGRIARRQEQRRIGQRNGVDDVHDVAARAVARRRDRLRERHRLAARQAAQSALLRQLAPKRVLHRLPRLDPAARQQPVGAPRLLVPHEHERVAAVQEPADAQSRRLVLHARPLDPKPCSPRALAPSASRTVTATSGSATTTSCAMRIPGSIRKGSSRSVLSSVTRISPR